MKTSEEIFIVPGKDAPESWRATGKDSAVKVDPGKGKSAGWVAVPVRSMVSVPMRFSAMPADRRQAAAALELEGLGLHASDTDFQVEVRDADQREQRAWTVVQTPTLPAHVSSAPLDAKFAPSVCFRNLKRGEVQIWSEAGHLAVAVPDEQGKPLHAQSLTALVPDDDAAAELRCILMALDLGGISPDVNEVVISQPADAVQPPEAFSEFAAGVGMPVLTETEKTPHLPAEDWKLLPPAVVHRRNQRRQAQTMMLAAVGCVVLLLTLLGAYAGRLWTRERSLAQDIARIEEIKPELELIKEAKDRWTLLEPAVSPTKFAMEQYHLVARVLPDKDLRLEDFSLQDGSMIIQGTALNPGLTNQLQEDLGREQAFSGFQWDFQTPTSNADGTVHFRWTGGPPTEDNTRRL